MGQSMFFVKLINKGRVIEVTVPAYNPPEAKTFAETQYPGYKAMSARRIG
jgi:hypothetical protein